MKQNQKASVWLEKLENMAIRAFEGRQQDRLRAAARPGLVPGEPVDGGQLQRKCLEFRLSSVTL